MALRKTSDGDRCVLPENVKRSLSRSDLTSAGNLSEEMAAAPSLPLILAREFTANVATPFLVLDREGTLV